MNRHRYRPVPNSNGLCECNQGRSEDVHNLMKWNKSIGSGAWVGNLYGNTVYRCRPSNPYGKAGKVSVWWPEHATIESMKQANNGPEGWTRIGDERGKSLTQAKLMCEEHREENA